MPLEGEPPVEAADHGLVRLHVELKRVPVDGVDDGAHDGAGVLADPGIEGGSWVSWDSTHKHNSLWWAGMTPPLQQRLHPAGDTLAVAVEEGQHVARGVGGADEPRPHQPLPLVGADEAHSLQVADVVGQLGLQVA